MQKVLNSDEDEIVRLKATSVLASLVCPETAGRMGQHKGLLDTLAITSMKDKNAHVQKGSSVALTKIASHVTIKMECYEALLDALVVASLSKCATNVSAVIRAKTRNAENRITMARHPGILDTLADICANPESSLRDKENAVRAILHLTNEKYNLNVVCNKNILDALVICASADDPKMNDIQQVAIQAIVKLATERSNRKYMAKHDGMLVAITKAVDKEAALEESGAGMEQSFQAKPILMSLLVAM